MSERVPDIIAELRLYPSEPNGRLSSICSGEYRGVLGIGSEHFSARWVVRVGEELVPGGRAGTFGIRFLFPETALPHFTVGATFTVCEGKEIGSRRVLSVAENAYDNQKKVEMRTLLPILSALIAGCAAQGALRGTHGRASCERKLHQFVGGHSNDRAVLRGRPSLQRHSSPCVLQYQLQGAS